VDPRNDRSALNGNNCGDVRVWPAELPHDDTNP